MGRAASTSERTSSLSLSAVSALRVGGEERREEVVDETLSAAMVTASSCWEVREGSVAGSCECVCVCVCAHECIQRTGALVKHGLYTCITGMHRNTYTCTHMHVSIHQEPQLPIGC